MEHFATCHLRNFYLIPFNLNYFLTVLAYTIGLASFGNRVQDVQNAVNEALAIVAYASFRVTNGGNQLSIGSGL